MRRLFTFGCSYTSWYWPTWADLLGYSFDQHQNWGVRGLGNRAILERLNECVLKEKPTKDDVIIVQWTDFHRHDVHYPGIVPGSNWRSGGSLLAKEVEVGWIRDTWREESYVMHSLNFINLGITLLKSLPAQWFITSSVDVRPDLDKFPKLEFYRTVFEDNQWLPSIQEYAIANGYKGIWCRYIKDDRLFSIKRKDRQFDLHPTPEYYQMWLEENLLPKLDISLDADIVERVKEFSKIEELDYAGEKDSAYIFKQRGYNHDYRGL